MQERTPGHIYDALFSTPEMAALFSDTDLLRAMIRVEVALAEALEKSSLAPAGTAAAIATVQPEDLDKATLSTEVRAAGNLCIPFVKALTAAVEEANPAAAGFVHWGATSQDVQDTATLLQARSGWNLLLGQLDILCDTLATLAERHKETVLAGRTWLQQGPPVTLGLKIAGWLDALMRHRARIVEARQRIFVVQFGGAVGTLAALGDSATRVASDLAANLSLGMPLMPWHTHRDRMVEMAVTLGMLVGTLGKMGRDISLLMQTEVGECVESFGSGGSSTMPHKRNPVSSAIMLSAAIRVPPLVSTMLSAMVQEHERGLGGWHAEWETLPEIFCFAAASLNAAISMTRALQVDEEAMAANMSILRGVTMSESLVFALAPKLGKQKARAIVEEITRCALAADQSLLQTALNDERIRGVLSLKELERALEPSSYLGCSAQWVGDVLRAHGDKDANG